MKIVFWNVDTQYDFMRNDDSFRGALPIEGARAIEEKLAELTKYARAQGIQIVSTADWHDENTKEISESPDFVTRFPPHCMNGTKGAEYVPATQPINPYIIDWQDSDIDVQKVLTSRELVLKKDEFSIFTGSPHTEHVLDLLKPDSAVVYGVATNVCVDYAVQGLLDRNIWVYVVKDAIKELPGLPLEETLSLWQRKGAIFTTTDDVIGNRFYGGK